MRDIGTILENIRNQVPNLIIKLYQKFPFSAPGALKYRKSCEFKFYQILLSKAATKEMMI
jgi:hypothetical protein